MNNKLLNDDTIAAVATGMAGAGIGIIRISGDSAIDLIDPLFINPKGKTLKEAASHQLLYGHLRDPQTKRDIDEVLVSKMVKPTSYTAEDVVEINCHGGIVPMQKILKMILATGIRLAEPGEFTKRAFLNGRLDLSQAEAVMDIINAKTEKSLDYSLSQLEGKFSSLVEAIDKALVDLLAHVEVTIDYPEYEIEEVSKDLLVKALDDLILKIDGVLKGAEVGKIYREGITTAIVGAPNVGKSSLLNSLTRENKAIVTNIPGTTRDTIEEYVNIEGIPFKMIDTAGIRETDNEVEKIGVEKSKKLLKEAHVILFMRDATKELSAGEEEVMALLKNKETIYIANKTDLSPSLALDDKWLSLSLIKDQGIGALKEKMVALIHDGSVSQEADYLVTNSRHIQKLKETKAALISGKKTIDAGMPIELVSIDLIEALEAEREISGKAIGMDVVNQIFENFCIGK